MPTDSQNSFKGKSIPAEVGVWLFLFIDLCIFSLYFFVFAWGKSSNPEMYQQGQASLNSVYGGVNTIVLLVSSYFMAKAVKAARQDNIKRFQRFLTWTALGGITFLVIKVLEYAEKFNAGYNIVTNEFYRNYFSFTGFHLLHLLFGLGFLFYLFIGIRTDTQARNKQMYIESIGLYWHMVDLLWVVLFTLIYLVP